MYDFFVIALAFFFAVGVTTTFRQKAMAAVFMFFFSSAFFMTVYVERDSLKYFKVKAEERNTAGHLVHERFSKKLGYLADRENDPAFDGATVLLELLRNDSDAQDSFHILKELTKLSTPEPVDLTAIRAAVKAAGNLRIAENQSMYDSFTHQLKNSIEFHTKVLWPVFDYFGIKSDMPRKAQPWTVKTFE